MEKQHAGSLTHLRNNRLAQTVPIYNPNTLHDLGERIHVRVSGSQRGTPCPETRDRSVTCTLSMPMAWFCVTARRGRAAHRAEMEGIAADDRDGDLPEVLGGAWHA